MDVFSGRLKKLEEFRDYTLRGKDLYVVCTDNLNNEHNIYGYLIYSKKRLHHVIIGNNSVTKDGCYMKGVYSAKSLDIFKDESIDIATDRIRAKYGSLVSELKMRHVYSPNGKLSQDKHGGPLCIKVLVVNLFNTYMRGESNKTFSHKMIGHILEGLPMVRLDANVGQKIIPRIDHEDTESLLLKEFSDLSKENIVPCFPIVVDQTLLKSASSKCIDSHILVSRVPKDVFDFQAFTMEDCGKPFSRYLLSGRMLGDITKESEAMKSALFHVFFGIYVMNVYGFIHGDLNLTNVVVRESATWKDKVNYSLDSCYCRYEIANETYFSEFFGAFPTIIDFGRSKQFDRLSNNKEKIRIELGDIDVTSPLLLMQALNKVDLLRFCKGMLLFLRTSSTSTLDSEDPVRVFLIETIDSIASFPLCEKKKIHEHMHSLISFLFESLKKQKTKCMSFSGVSPSDERVRALNEAVFAARANEYGLPR